MWKALDRIVSAIIRRLFKPEYHVERVERYQQCDDMVVWFYSSLEDIGRKPFAVALLERSGKDTWPTIRRPT